MGIKTISFEPYNALKAMLEVTSSKVGDQFLEAICFELKKLFEADLVFITKPLDQPITKALIQYSTSEDFTGEISIVGTPCGLVYKNGLINIDKGVNKDFKAISHTDFEAFYGIPLYDQHKTCIGHIAIVSNTPRILPAEAEDIAQLFARRAEAEIIRIKLERENQRITQQMIRQSITDHLTGLHNRRFFVEKALESFTQFKRGALKDVCIVFMDIDDFKLINDTYGHKIGDHVLRESAQVMQESCREKIDYIARVGGEEYGIISLNTNLRDTQLLCERIMRNVTEHFKDNHYTITFSVGIAAFNIKDESWEIAYNVADNRMYQAKNSGKNKIVTQSFY